MKAEQLCAICLAGGGLWMCALGLVGLGAFTFVVGAAWLWDESGADP